MATAKPIVEMVAHLVGSCLQIRMIKSAAMSIGEIMKKIKGLLFAAILLIPVYSFAGEEYRLLYRSPQVEGAYPSNGLDPERGRFTARFYVDWSTVTALVLEEFDLEGKKIRDLDISGWREHGMVAVPGRNLYVYTELTICPKPLKVEICDYNSEGYLFNVASGTILYHSPKFERNYPDFTADGKYMLGKFGWEHSEGDEYYPSTGTCLIEIDTGREIWCKEEAVSQHAAYLSEKSGIIVGDKAIYDFFSGKRLMTFPQFSKKGDKTFTPQREGMAIIVRALSPDGRYFVATEGKCDAERMIRRGVESACNMVNISELETYLGEWDRGIVKKKIKVFEDNVRTIDFKPFFFLPDGLLVSYVPYPARIQLMDMKGEVVSTITNDKASGISPLSVWRLQPQFYNTSKVVVWPSAEENEWRVYGLDGKLIGEFIWKEPQGRDSHVRGFGMINDREYIFTVDIVTKKNKGGGTIEYVSEVYRGRFGAESGK